MEIKSDKGLNSNQLLQLASRAIKSNKIPEAETILEAIIEKDEKFGPAFNHLGWIYSNVYNDINQGEKHYQKALDLSPEYPPTYTNYALLLNISTRFEDLEKLLEKAMLIPGVNKARIREEYGVMYELLQRYDEAKDAYREAIKESLETKDVQKYQDGILRCGKKQEILKK